VPITPEKKASASENAHFPPPKNSTCQKKYSMSEFIVLIKEYTKRNGSI